MLLIRIVLPCCILFEYATGCGRNSNQPKSQSQTAANNQVEMPENHRLKCTENETQTIACRNGGTCFAAYIEYRSVRCACFKKYIGERCEMIDINVIFKEGQGKEETTNAALVAGSITIGSLIVLFLTVSVIVIISIKKCKCLEQYTYLKNDRENV